MKTRTLIIGAAGRDFHNFNAYFRDNERFEVVGFTASRQIPGISGREYPAALAGRLYPEGIPIYAEEDLPRLIKELRIDVCVFAYSDVTYNHVMGVGAIVEAAGASFMMLGPNDTMLKSNKPVISVCAVRTGAGKSQTSRVVMDVLARNGLKAVSIRHPMPYGDLVAQKVQRYAELSDLEKHHCTIEEMEEYEPYIVQGNVIYAGVDYQAILDAAEQDPKGCDVILWDGGNNDFPFYRTDLLITVVDPHRAGHEVSYYPGEICLRMADVVVINKLDSAKAEDVQTVRENIERVNPNATVVSASSPVTVDDPDVITGKRVLCIEDGPTLTHGEMTIGAGTIAAQRFGAAELVDPRPYTVGEIAESFERYPHIGPLLPAMGYGKQQLKDLETT
ncbi:MAG: cyclic 2,3-diphosphoglycerate synthase, partial [Dehalococcoidia bacterium]